MTSLKKALADVLTAVNAVPNYRRASGQQTCTNCSYGFFNQSQWNEPNNTKLNHCSKYQMSYINNYVCDAWEAVYLHDPALASTGTYPDGSLLVFETKMLKADEERQIVYGFASVIEENGMAVVDRQGDVIEEEDLIQAAHNFMTDYRQSKVMHSGKTQGEVVESVVLTKALQAALNVDLGKVGWLVAVKVYDPTVWKRVKSGELSCFSIGGTARRIPLNGDQA